MSQDLLNWMADWREVILAGAGLVLLVATMAVGFLKRSLLAAFATLMFGALLWWGMANSSWLRDRAGSDFDAAPVHVVIDVDIVEAQ